MSGKKRSLSSNLSAFTSCSFRPVGYRICAMSRLCVCQGPESGTETSQTQAQPPPQEACQDQPCLDHISHPLSPPLASLSPSGLSHLALVHISIGIICSSPGMFSLLAQSVSLVNPWPRPRARSQQEGAGRTPAKAWSLLRPCNHRSGSCHPRGRGGDCLLTLFRLQDSLLP